jgi:hypothetical protein
MLTSTIRRALSDVNSDGWKGIFKVVGESPHFVESEMHLADVKGSHESDDFAFPLGLYVSYLT